MLQNIQLRKIGPWKHRYTPPPSNRSLDNGYTSNAEDNLACTTNKDCHSSTKSDSGDNVHTTITSTNELLRD